MRRALWLLGLASSLLTSVVATPAFAQDPTDAGPGPSDASKEEPAGDAAASAATTKEAEAPVRASDQAAKEAVLPKPETPDAPEPRPKLGDITMNGYFRGGFGASNQKGRMTCFSLSNPSGLQSKYRLGNECEVWAEAHFTAVAYSGDDGVVARMHFMPTVFIPTTFIGYSPNGATSVPDQGFPSTGATVAFPNLYVDLKGVPWLFGGTAWVGSRYYKREAVYISDFFYWNPSGVGAGIEDIELGRDLRLSYGAFAVDGETAGSPPLPAQIDFGLRNDIQLRGIKPWSSGELQVGFQFILNYSNNPSTHGGYGGTLQFVQKLLGGENKLAFQYGRGGGTGFGTLARFYYPDFSVRHDLSEGRLRAVDVLTIQPIEWLGTQLAVVYQHDQNFLGTRGQTTDWYSAGGRVGFAFTRHAKLLGEVGYDQVKRNNGSHPQYLAKFTPALALTADRGFWARPELRLFYTWAMWNGTARTANIDSSRELYRTSNFLSGATFGVQGEAWW
jgi:maltoporin